MLFIAFRQRRRKRKREKHQSIFSGVRPDWNQTIYLGMCPDQELNLQPFGVQDNSPTNQVTPARAHFISWPSLDSLFILLSLYYILLRKYLALLSSCFYILLWCCHLSTPVEIVSHSSTFTSYTASVNYFRIPQIEFKFLSTMVL